MLAGTEYYRCSKCHVHVLLSHEHPTEGRPFTCFFCRLPIGSSAQYHRLLDPTGKETGRETPKVTSTEMGRIASAARSRMTAPILAKVVASQSRTSRCRTRGEPVNLVHSPYSAPWASDFLRLVDIVDIKPATKESIHDM